MFVGWWWLFSPACPDCCHRAGYLLHWWAGGVQSLRGDVSACSSPLLPPPAEQHFWSAWEEQDAPNTGGSRVQRVRRALVRVWTTPSYPASKCLRTGGKGAEAAAAAAARCAGGLPGRAQPSARGSIVGSLAAPPQLRAAREPPSGHPPLAERRSTAGDASWEHGAPRPGSPRRDAAPPPPVPAAPGPLPSTLVRVRTGLLQALSGATRAECFFMMSLPPAGAPPPIAYILGPAGARLSRFGGLLRGGARAVSLRPCLPGLGLPVGLLSPSGSLRRPPLQAHLPWSCSHPRHARTAACSELAANSNVTYKCTPRSHPAGSPAPPPALGCPAPQPESPPESLVLAAASGLDSSAGHQLPICPLIRAAPGGRP